MCSSKDTRKLSGRAPAEAAPQAVREEQQTRKRNREEQQPHSRCVSFASSVSNALGLHVGLFHVIAFGLRA